MKTVPAPTRLCAGDPADADLLLRVAELVEASLFDVGAEARHEPRPPEDAGSHGSLVIVQRDDTGLRLGFRALDAHPFDALLGFTAPAGWWCLGVAAWGVARAADPRTGRPTADGEPARHVHLVHLVSRAGDSVTVHRRPGDDPHTVQGPDATAGRIDDVCRRALGLPTAPPPSSTVGLWAGRWLDRLLSAAVAGELERATWAEVASLHPAASTARHGADDAVGRWAVADLGRAGDVLAGVFGWSRLLAGARVTPDGHAPLTPGLAAWMDEGIYARSLLATLPDAADAIGDLAALLPAVTAERLRATLQHWQLLPAARP